MKFWHWKEKLKRKSCNLLINLTYKYKTNNKKLKDMCKFYSAIVSRSGELYHKTSLISHEDIIDYYNLNDSSLHDNICRVEFYPDNTKDILDINMYKLHVDEDCIPNWFEEYKESTIDKLKDIINNMIIKTNTKILCDGGYILGNNIIVNQLKNSIIYYAGYATIENANYATIKNANYATIENAGSATIENAGSATIENANYATIKYANYATIENAGSATIKDAGYATIENANYATIKDAGYATIHDANNATIENAGNATIKHAGSATIKDAGYATIKDAGYATIIDAGNATIKHAGSATITK
jgi:hypothetical protein